MESNRQEKVVATTPQEQQTETKAQDVSPSPGSVSHEKISPAPSFEETMKKDNDMKYNANVDEKDLGMNPTHNSDMATEEEKPVPKWKQVLRKYMWVLNLFLWLVLTAWWIVGLVLHRELGWLIPTLIWIALTIRFVTAYVSTRFVTAPIKWVWMKAVYNPTKMIPEKMRTPLSAAAAISIVLIGTFATEETPQNTRSNRAISLLGLLVFLAAFYITSRDRKAIVWQTVIVGMLAQFIIAIFVLRTKAGYDIFNFIAYLASTLLGMASAGTIFLTNPDVYKLQYFIVNVLPPIIFFVAFVQLLYYFGWLQWFIRKFATVFFYTMKVSGAEAVVAAASPFVGQGESAMLIKPFIPHLTDAEMHQVMCSGFATIAGSVLAVYISMGISPVALVSSCVMSIPASLAISKLRYPETEETLTSGQLVIPEDDEERPSNFLHAFANGSWLGLKVAGMILAALLCILSLLKLVNSLLTWWGHYFSITELTIELILGYVFYPIAFFLGVSRDNDEILLVSRLIGIKIIANEFVAFEHLTKFKEYEFLSQRSKIIATYAVCGFGNISSVGIQIGVLSTLAPGKSGRVAKVALSALISGVMATLTSASIAGMLISDNAGLFTGFTPKIA